MTYHGNYCMFFSGFSATLKERNDQTTYGIYGMMADGRAILTNPKVSKRIIHLEATPSRNENETQPTQPMPFHAVSKRTISSSQSAHELPKKEPSKTCPTTYLTTSCSGWLPQLGGKNIGGGRFGSSLNRFCERKGF